MPSVACEALWLWDRLCNPKESKQVQCVGKVKFRSVLDFFATRSSKVLEVHRLLCLMTIGLAKLPLPLLSSPLLCLVAQVQLDKGCVSRSKVCPAWMKRSRAWRVGQENYEAVEAVKKSKGSPIKNRVRVGLGVRVRTGF